MQRILAAALVTGIGGFLVIPGASADPWTGPYIGIGGGYGIANEKLDFAPGPLVPPIISGNLALDGVASKGGFLSLSAGYDHQLNSALLIGAFVDYDFYDVDGSISLSVPPVLGASAGFKIENQLSVGGRIGYIASPSTLIFANAGYARVETSNIDFAVGLGGLGLTGTLASVPNFDGYFLGGGIETKIGHGLSLKAEYRYTDLGAEHIELLPGLGIGGLITSTMEPVIQTGRLSLNYRFGGDSNAVAEEVAAAPARSWTGGYVSAGIGQGAASDELTLSSKPPLPAVSAGIDGIGFHGGVFGVGAGYDFQVSPKFVFGGFADANFSELKNENSLNIAAGPLAINGGLSTQIDNLFMIGGRLGYLATPDTLIFGSLGYANAEFGDTNFNASLSLGGPPLSVNGTLIESKRVSGVFLGGGIETRLSDSLALKAEYRYIDFGSEDVTLLPGIAPIVNNFVRTEIDPTVQTGMVSLVYRFGASAPPAPLK